MDVDYAYRRPATNAGQVSGKLVEKDWVVEVDGPDPDALEVHDASPAKVARPGRA